MPASNFGPMVFLQKDGSDRRGFIWVLIGLLIIVCLGFFWAQLSFVLIHMSFHIIWVLPFAHYCRKKYGNKASLVILLSVIAIDADHFIFLINYSLSEAWIRLITLTPISHTDPFLAFHSIELALILVVIGRRQMRTGWIWEPLGLGIANHLLVDLTSYSVVGITPANYSSIKWLLSLL